MEIEPFMIELPIESPENLDRYREKVCKHSGVKYLHMRQVAHRKKGGLAVWIIFNSFFCIHLGDFKLN